MVEKKCNHKWVHYNTFYDGQQEGRYLYYWRQVDQFHCEKCCETTEKTTREARTDDARRPQWFKSDRAPEYL